MKNKWEGRIQGEDSGEDSRGGFKGRIQGEDSRGGFKGRIQGGGVLQ